jgi:hypothetical protein
MWSINPFINPNPVESHPYTWQYDTVVVLVILFFVYFIPVCSAYPNNLNSVRNHCSRLQVFLLCEIQCSFELVSCYVL